MPPEAGSLKAFYICADLTSEQYKQKWGFKKNQALIAKSLARDRKKEDAKDAALEGEKKCLINSIRFRYVVRVAEFNNPSALFWGNKIEQ